MTVDDTEELERKRMELDGLLGGGVGNAEGKHIEEVVAGQTTIRWDPSVANKEKDCHHIDFAWGKTTAPLRNSFMQLVDMEIKMRGLDQVTGASNFIRDKIVSLKKSLLDGAKVAILRKSLDRVVDKSDKFLYPMDKAVPCILHMENRVGEKLITMCLVEGLAHRNAGVGAKEYFKEVEELVNNGVLHVENGNWKLPVNGDTLSTVSLSNSSARVFALNIGKLFDLIFRHHEPSDDRRGRFERCVVTMYQPIMKKLRKRSNLTVLEINTLQQNIDVWYENWINLTGREGMTNYIHMLGAGHVQYYLLKKRNLYRYSNQGWERLNKRVKRCYLTKTQRGGGMESIVVMQIRTN